MDFTVPIANGPTTRGFDYYFGTAVPNFPPYCFIENDRTVGIPTEKKPDNMFGTPGAMLKGWKIEEILPALTGRKLAGPIREATVHHSISGMFAIRQGRWKLILGRGSGGWSGRGRPQDPPVQLYDMTANAAEQRNLSDEYPEVVEPLARLLEKFKNGRTQQGR